MLETTEQRIFSFSQLVTAWRRDHCEAKQSPNAMLLLRMELETIFKDAVRLKLDIEKLHRFWIEEVTSGRVERSLTMDVELYKVLKHWFDAVTPLIDLLPKLAGEGIKPKHSQTLSSHFNSLKETLEIIAEPRVPVGPVSLKANCDSFDLSRYDD